VNLAAVAILALIVIAAAVVYWRGLNRRIGREWV
jgi:hypothetical protein